MTLILIAAGLLCLSIPAAVLAALVYNDRDAQRAELGSLVPAPRAGDQPRR